MSETTEQVINPEIIEEAWSYDSYRQMIDSLLSEGKTTGRNHSGVMIQYTKMNVHRMNRLDNHTGLSEKLAEKLQEVQEPWVWLVLTEAWCGDAAQNVPIIAKMADENPNITLRFLLRDEHPDIMDQYLTNGGRSIPKLICLNANTLEEIGTWGPRPAVLQDKAMAWKDDPSIGKEEWVEKLHKWYADDKARTLQSDFEALIEEWQR